MTARETSGMAAQPQDLPTVLILTPVKDARRYLDGYVERLEHLSYPKDRLSIGFNEGDSVDGTYEALQGLVPRLENRCARVTLIKRDLGFRLPPDVPRWADAYQVTRRINLARARNQLLFRALREETWVLWLDVDVIAFPSDLIEQLLAFGRDILHPHCTLTPGGPTFDLNAWRNKGSEHMQDLRGSMRPVRLDSVGGTVLLVRADLHRDGLIFPPFRYGVGSERIRRPHPVWGEGEIETEGFGILALDMGLQCWGLPDFEVQHAKD
jgi:peptide chain release factor subunit 1